MNKIGAASPVTSVPIASPLLVSSVSPLCLVHGISKVPNMVGCCTII